MPTTPSTATATPTAFADSRERRAECRQAWLDFDGAVPPEIAQYLDAADELAEADLEPVTSVTTVALATTAATTTAPVADTLLPITIYRPEQLYVGGDPARGWLKTTTGTSGSVTWAQLCRLLGPEQIRVGDPIRYPNPSIAKSARGGFSLCALEEGRRVNAAFRGTRLMGIDIDHHGDVDAALRAFAPWRKIVLSTYNSAEADPRCRVILPLAGLSRDSVQFRRGHIGLRGIAVAQGCFQDSDFDNAGQDPVRLWFLPMVRPGALYTFQVTDGELLDLDRLAPPNPPPTNAYRERNTTGFNSGSAAALSHARQKQAQAVEPHRHTTAYSSAAWLAELEPYISDADIEDALLPHAPEGREAEFRRTIRDGVRAGRAKAGT